MNDEERERADFIEKYAPWYKKMEYRPMLQIPAEPWRVDASWRDAYFRASKEIIQGVVDGRLMPAIHGIAGVFMFRHYMELAISRIPRPERRVGSGNGVLVTCGRTARRSCEIREFTIGETW